MSVKVIAVVCPVCLRMKPLEKDDKIASHDGSVCTGSHMEYGTCKGSGKKLKPFSSDEEYNPHDS